MAYNYGLTALARSNACGCGKIEKACGCARIERVPQIRVLEIPRDAFEEAVEFKGYVRMTVDECAISELFGCQGAPIIVSTSIYGDVDFGGLGQLIRAEIGNGTSFNYFFDSTNRRFGLTFNTVMSELYIAVLEFRSGKWRLGPNVCSVRVAYLTL